MCPWPSSSTCSAASPCTRLSRPPSTTSGSDFHDSVALPMEGPFSRPTRSIAFKTIVDLPGSVTLPYPPVPCSQTPPESPAPSPLAGAYWCLPSFRPCRPPVHRITRLNRFTCVTARTSLCLRLAHVVTSTSPRLDSRWSGSFSLPGRELHPLEAPGFAWRAEERSNVQVEHPVHLLAHDPDVQGVQRVVLAAPRPEPIRKASKVLFPHAVENRPDRMPDDLVLQRCDSQWAL